MTHSFDLIGFDADDTLWHNESLYSMTQGRFKELLADYHDGEIVDRELYETEVRNLARYGYGIKAFTLSMIETAIELTEGRIPGYQIQKIIECAHEMLNAPVDVFDGVRDVLTDVSGDYRLVLITKGDLLDQEGKLARSGLAELFDHVEIVTEKLPSTYAGILQRLEQAADRFLMVGNSLRSDVLPVVAAGGHGVHIPYHTTWEHEQVSESAKQGNSYTELADIRELSMWLAGNSSQD